MVCCMNIKKYKDKIIFSLFIIIVFLLIFILQSNVPMLGYDDYILNSSHGRDISYLISIINNNIINWNGRSLQIIGCLIGFLPRWCFWIINTFAIILFVYLVYYYSFSELEIKHKNEKYKNIILTVLLVSAYILYLFPATFDVFFWMPGACNHLWSVIITLLFLIPYYKLLYGKNVFENKKSFIIILYILSGSIVGSSLENISIFGILFILYTLIKSSTKKRYTWQVGGFISYIVGVAYLYFLPSTSKRKLKFLNGTNIIQNGIKKIQYILEYFFVENKILIILVLLILIAYIIYIKRKNIKDLIFNNILLLFFFTIPTLFIFYLSSYYSNRALLLLSFMSITLIIYMISQLINNKKKILLILCILLSFDIYAYNHFLNVYITSNKAFTIRNNDIQKQLRSKPNKINYDLIPCVYGIRIIEYKEYISEDNPKDNNNYDNSGFKSFYDIGNDVVFKYNKNYEKYSKYCVKENPIFNVMGFSGYDVKNKYEWIGYNDKKNNKK